MFAFSFGGPEAIILLVIILVIFGGSQLPKLAKNLGKAQKEFRDGLDEGQREAAQRQAVDDAVRTDEVRREVRRDEVRRDEVRRSIDEPSPSSRSNDLP